MKIWLCFRLTRPSAPVVWSLLACLMLSAGSTANTIIPDQLKPLVAPQPQFVFSRWTKSCQNQQQGDNQEACYTSMNGRTQSGSLVAAMLIDPGHPIPKILRITLPLGMELQSGTWIAVDQNPTLRAPYAFCILVGCVADYKANDHLLDLLKGGKELVIRSVDAQGQVVTFSLPLLDFGRLYSGLAGRRQSKQ